VPDYDRVYLEKVRLAIQILLDLPADSDLLNSALETDLHLLKDRIELALLN